MNHQELAAHVAQLVGGPDNVESLTNCVTRLRFVLIDPSKADLDALNATPGVIRAQHSGAQTQVVIGTQVNAVRKAIEALPGWGLTGKSPSSGTTTPTPGGARQVIDRLFDFLSGTFQPLLYALMGGATAKVLILIIAMFWKYDPSNLPTEIAVLNAAANALFYFLPIFVGITASKKLGANPYLGGMIAAALMEPSFVALGESGDVVQFLGAPLYLFTYANGMISALLSSVALSYLERGLKRVVPEILELILVPFLCLVVLVPLSALVIGPFSVVVGNALAAGLNALSTSVPLLFYVLVGTGWVFLVMLGLHWALMPLVIMSLSTTGHSDLLGAAFAYQAAMAGVGLGMMLRARRERDTGTYTLAVGSFVSAVIGGITEPTLYGLVMRYRKVLVAEVAGAFAASLVAGIFRVTGHALVMSPIFGAPAITPLPAYLLTLLTGLVCSATLIYFRGYSDTSATSSQQPSAAATALPSIEVPAGGLNDVEVVSPATGRIVPLSEVPDPIFAGQLLGKGVAIDLTEPTICSPVDGQVIMLPDSRHAIGIRTAEGAEVLIHVGLETVSLGGRGFQPLVAQGQQVTTGQSLLEVDLEQLRQAGLSLITPVIVTNARNHDDVGASTATSTSPGEPLFTLHRKASSPVSITEDI